MENPRKMDKPISLLDCLLSGARNNVLIITDWEPDDMIAIHMLLLELLKRNIIPTIVVSCWKDILQKAHFIRQYLREITLIPIDIHLGLPSDKEYDISSMITAPCEETFQCWEAMEWNQYSLIVQLAPVYELMDVFLRGSPNFSGTKLAIYASFNIRSVLDKYNPSQILEMLGSFRQVIYYESFLATSPTIVGNESRDVLECISKHSNISKYIKLWNDLIYKEVKDDGTCTQIAKSIEDCPQQFVHADTGLILTLIMPLCDIRHSLMTGKLSLAPPRHFSIFADLISACLGEQMIVVCNETTRKDLYQQHMQHMKSLL